MYPYNSNPNGMQRRIGSITHPMIFQTDSGNMPYIANLHGAASKNQNYRTALWTGSKLQMTVMSIPPNGNIGVEIHPHTDQFFYIEQGQGMAMMGDDKNSMNFRHNIFPGFAVIVPAGKWHDIINTGKGDLKLFTVYAPPNHKKGTVHPTKKDAEKEENH